MSGKIKQTISLLMLTISVITMLPVDPARAASTITVFYDANGANGLFAQMHQVYEDQNKTPGDNYTIFGWVYTKNGMPCEGFNTEPDGSGTHYAGGSEIKLPSENLYLYAQWPTFTVTYNPNSGGTGNTYAKKVEKNTEHTVLDMAYTRNGYRFNGYNTASAGNGTSYNIGSKFTVSSDTPLYAKWIATVNITYEPNGATTGSSKTVTIDKNTNHKVESTCDGVELGFEPGYESTNLTIPQTSNKVFTEPLYIIAETQSIDFVNARSEHIGTGLNLNVAPFTGIATLALGALIVWLTIKSRTHRKMKIEKENGRMNLLQKRTRIGRIYA